MSIRIGIYGYGNLGRGVENAIRQNSDMELVAVFTRRDPASVKIGTEGVCVYNCDEEPSMADIIDVVIALIPTLRSLSILQRWMRRQKQRER